MIPHGACTAAAPRRTLDEDDLFCRRGRTDRPPGGPGFGPGPGSREGTRPTDGGGVHPLFDGKSLAGWHPHNEVPQAHVGGKWVVRDGLWSATRAPTARVDFVTDGKCRDFVLRVEVKMDYPTDSGPRPDGCRREESSNHPRSPTPGGNRPLTSLDPGTGAEQPRRHQVFQGRRLEQPEVRVEERAGPHPLPGKRAPGDRLPAHGRDDQGVPAEGFIGLQVHPTVPNLTVWKDGNLIRYRNIRIRPLAPAGETP
ncbi:MAG: DUF1080 domain-containing protein [Singulisphaera sp.]